MSGRPVNSTGLIRTGSAEAFVGAVAASARRAGHDVPCMNHWLLAICSRQFIARTLISDSSASDVASQAHAQIEARPCGCVVGAAVTVGAVRRCVFAGGLPARIDTAVT